MINVGTIPDGRAILAEWGDKDDDYALRVYVEGEQGRTRVHPSEGYKPGAFIMGLREGKFLPDSSG